MSTTAGGFPPLAKQTLAVIFLADLGTFYHELASLGLRNTRNAGGVLGNWRSRSLIVAHAFVAALHRRDLPLLIQTP
jgi:hypothetical protein